MRQGQFEDSASNASNRKLAIVVRPVDGQFLRKLQREAKEVRGWSARVTAEHLKITRATLKGMQSGSKSIGEMPQIHARNLHRELLKDRAEQGRANRGLLVVTFAGGWDARMRQLKLARKPRKCRVCGCWFEPHSGRQQRCSVCVSNHLPRCKRRMKQRGTG